MKDLSTMASRSTDGTYAVTDVREGSKGGTDGGEDTAGSGPVESEGPSSLRVDQSCG